MSQCVYLLYAGASAILDLICDLLHELLLFLPLLVLQAKRLVLQYIARVLTSLIRTPTRQVS